MQHYAIYKAYKLSKILLFFYWVKTWHQDGRIFSIIYSLNRSAVRNDRRLAILRRHKLIHYMHTWQKLDAHWKIQIHDKYHLELTAIEENAFQHLVMTKLSFDVGNNISVVRESFKGLKELRNLDPNNNMIPLSSNLFSELKQLRSLFLKFNKIKEIFKDSFVGQYKLYFNFQIIDQDWS